MVLNKISAVAVGSMLCVQVALSETLPADLPSDTLTTAHRADRTIDIQLELIADSINFVDLKDEVELSPMFTFVPATVAGRLAYLQKDVPLTYNAQVQSYIDAYSTERYKRHLEQMMGLSQYYFPIYERSFMEAGVPEEIKYLSIIESALNPHAVSRVGATGLWQFMYATARMYDLVIDSYVDERKDPIAASRAAAAYLADAYNEFGDWLLAIASYNCGQGNVLRAMRRTGLANPNYWDISPFLPRETRNYVPALIAITYMLEYAEEHDITPAATTIPVQTEMVWVQKHVPLRGVAKALDVEEEVIKSLNPAYKRGVVNGTADMPKRLILPEAPPQTYPALYAVLNTPNKMQAFYAANEGTRNAETTATTHRVRRGETLGKIANRYHVSVQDLKVWNGLKNHTIVPGQPLRIMSAGGGQAAQPASSTNASYISYRVKKGDTLSGIAQRYRKANVFTIKSDNGLRGSRIKPGMTLKIKVK
ncbi:LysM peptidoglycan-binding domain-containing protein [Parapedobacter sp. 10938]|uniref:LysM peptidoglycan-binding domain-containing protein n=1 Tax=Parapedobacter flavus TaxID=3110225 RepID=UPI002DBC4A10|nr:LysM peptidoglycan-binding domain-containing protein [Parapedobacter sp. 10938]MEC3879567.1 LysM peptidoglycan-binding domain-containing protein [Parapedobacter sp. 10938]